MRQSNFLSFVFLVFFQTTAFLGEAQKGNFFVEPELLVGFNFPNFSKFPESSSRLGYQLSVGMLHQDSESHWQGYYNFPSLGVSFLYSDLGSEVLGKELSIIPYLLLNTSRKRQDSFYFKFGLGLSYATNSYDSISNPGNEIIGAPWNWMLQIFLYRTLVVGDQWHVKLGAGALHTSNSHTSLPNFGLNSGMFSVAIQRFSRPIRKKVEASWKFISDKRKIPYFQVITGLGVHELGGTRRPVGGPNKLIPSISLEGGIIFRQHLKVKTGLTYRYYDSFHDDIINNQLPQFIHRPISKASHLFLVIGAEYLLAHVGLEVSSGITLHKPYFDYWFESNESTDAFALWQNKTFPTRVGGNLYLLNTNKNPRHNIFLGLHVNANWGTADFMGYTFGYVRRW